MSASLLPDYRGNLVFYQSYGTDPMSRFWTRMVQHFTHGPYVHVEIVYDCLKGGIWRTIGAQSGGILYSILPLDATTRTLVTLRSFCIDPTSKQELPVEPDRLAAALEWTQQHYGLSYGMIDNVTQGIDIAWPNNPLPEIVQPNHFNCSNFATAFLDKAGVCLPKNFTYPFNVSPNDLAELFDLLPTRKRILP